MKELSPIQSKIFLIGGLLMVVGAGCCAFLFKPAIFCFVYALGAIMFTSMQLMQRYTGKNVVIKRLRRIIILADVLFLLAAVSLIDTQYLIFKNLMSAVDYVSYVYNKWVMLLLCAAILEMYATHRLNNELTKESS